MTECKTSGAYDESCFHFEDGPAKGREITIHADEELNALAEAERQGFEVKDTWVKNRVAHYVLGLADPSEA